MRCLVTGGTGFLGTNIVHQCAEAGHSVKAMGLQGDATRYIEDVADEIIEGDVTVVRDVLEATRGVDAVIHVAGDTSFWKKRFNRQREINVEGPRNIAEACLENGVKRLVHTATVDVLGYNPDGLADESWEDFNYAGIGYNYAETKRDGEKIVLSYNGNDLEVISILPGSMLGPYDHTLQFGRLFMDIRDKKVPAILPGGAPWAHVREVARAHVTALTRGAPGERYICGGVNETYKTLFHAIAGSIGVDPRRYVMKPWMTVGYGYLMEFFANFTRKPPELNPGQARYMSVFPRYDSSKAEKALGFTIVSLEEMVNDARDWYRDNGYL